MPVPYDQGRPIWVDDDRFDITYHVRHTALPKPGSWEQLIALTTRVQESLLDRERPLWELWFVEGLEGGNVAMMQKTHHSLIDGVSGVDVATMLLDPSPDYVPPEPHEWTPEPAPSSIAAAARHVCASGSPSRPRSCVRCAALFRGPRRALAETQRVAQLDGHDGEPRGDRAEHVDQRAHRPSPPAVGRADTARRREERSARALGGTVNDVVLAGVGGGLAAPVRVPRRDDERAAAARHVPGVGALRRPTRLARQQGVGDVRVDPGRHADPRPIGCATISAQTADLKERAAGGRRRLPHQHDATTSRRP